MMRPVEPGDRVEYTGDPVYDGIIWTGDFGVVTQVEKGWVHARWPKSGVHSVPLDAVRPAPREGKWRVVTDAANRDIWGLFSSEDNRFNRLDGSEGDPYWEAGSHPDIVERVWDALNKTLPEDCRARAYSTPVLAHPATNRIFASAYGTQYALWLTPPDFLEALALGAGTVMTWSTRMTTDLAEKAGPGWIWGRWYQPEPDWLARSFRAAGGWATPKRQGHDGGGQPAGGDP